MYQNDRLNGFGRYISNTGTVQHYSGSWKNDKYSGHGICIYKDKAYYIGMWRYGFRNGKGIFVNAYGE